MTAEVWAKARWMEWAGSIEQGRGEALPSGTVVSGDLVGGDSSRGESLSGEASGEEAVSESVVGSVIGVMNWAIPRGAAGEGRPLFLRLGAGRGESAVEERALRKAEALFGEAMEAAPSRDPEDPIYEDWWRAARQRGENYLRLALGWDRFNRLSRAALEGELEKAGR